MAIFCYWDVTLKPKPLYPKGWALNYALKLLWNHSPIALIVVANHTLLNLALFFLETFLWATFSIRINVCSISHLDIFSYLSFVFYSLILSTTSFSNAFGSTLLSSGMMWPHVNWNSLPMALAMSSSCCNLGKHNRSPNFATPWVLLGIVRSSNSRLESSKFTTNSSC